MKKLKPVMFAIALAFGAVGLPGCGEGTSTGKVADMAIPQPPAGTQTTIVISNTTDRTYARVILLDKNNQILKEQEINCKPSATDCVIFLPTQVRQSATLLLQDAQRQMISAYEFPKTGIGSFSHVYPDSLTTGNYLVQKLLQDQSKKKITLDETMQQLMTFFENYKNSAGNTDVYVSLGDYYSQQTANGQVTEEEFFAKLSKRLAEWSIAKPDELSKTAEAAPKPMARTGRLASSASTSCSPALKTFLSVAEIGSKAIPVAGSAVSSAIKLGSDACSTDPSPRQIMSALTTLQTTASNTNKALLEMADFTYEGAITGMDNKFKSKSDSAIAYLEDYNKFVAPYGGSLKKYFEAKGGFTKGVEFGSTTLNKVLTTAELVNNLSTELYSAQTGLGDKEPYIKALNKRCGSLVPGANEDLLVVRTFCNASVLVNMAYLAGAQEGVLSALKDVYETLAFYEEKGENMNPFPSPTVVKRSAKGHLYSDAYQQVKEAFTAQQKTWADDMQTRVGVNGNGGLFNLYAGLNEDLKKNLVKRECAQPGDKSLPNIVGWFSPSAGTKNDDYIVTECRLVYAFNPEHMQRAKARYKYEYQGPNIDPNNVANVLGVPVAKHYVDTMKTINSQWSTENAKSTTVRFETKTLMALNNVAGEGRVDGIVPMKDVAPRDYVLHQQPQSFGRFYINIPAKDGSGFTWLSFIDKNLNRYVALMDTNYTEFRGGDYNKIISRIKIGCVTSDCRLGPGDEWLLFKRPGLSDYVVDVSDRGDFYQLGPPDNQQ